MRATRTVALAVVAAGAVGLGIVLLGRGATSGDGAPAPRPAQDDAAEAPRLAGSGFPPPEISATERADAAGWIGALGGEDADAKAAALEGLRDLLRGERLTPEELLRIALRPEGAGPAELLRRQALDTLRNLEPAALLPLFPALLDRLEKGTEGERAVAATIVPALVGSESLSDGPSAARAVLDEVRAALRAALPRTSALVADEGAPLDVRLAMLPLLEALGGEAAEVAPSLIAWVRATYRQREEYQAQNPGTHVTWRLFEYRIQEALSRLGPRVLPVLLEAVRAGSEETPRLFDGRFVFQHAIREMGPEALDALRPLLADADPGIRAIAVAAVARAGKDRPETASDLREALRDREGEVRVAALDGIKPYAEALADEIVTALGDPDADVRKAAAAAVDRVPDGPFRARERLLEILRKGEYGERLQAMGALAKLGPAAAEAAPLVVDLFADRLPAGHEEFMLASYFDAFKAFGPASVRALVDAAAEGDAKHRRAAVFALVRLEGVTAQDLGPLAPVLGTLAGEDRVRMAGLLAPDPAAVRVLLDELGGDDLDLRAAAADGLARAGAAAVSAIPRLADLLRDADARLNAEGAAWNVEWKRLYAYRTALQAAGRHAPLAVVAYLDDANDEVREAASLGLGAAGEAGALAVQAAWTGLSPTARAAVLPPLWPTGPNAPPPSATGRKIVLGALDDPTPSVRLAAVRVARGEKLEPRRVRTAIALLAVPDGDVAASAAGLLAEWAPALRAYEAELRAAMPGALPGVKATLQDALDRLEAAR